MRGQAKRRSRTARAIIVRSRRRAAKAHFALFKNLMKAKQRMRPELAVARANARRFRVKRLSKEAARPGGRSGENELEHRDDVSIP